MLLFAHLLPTPEAKPMSTNANDILNGNGSRYITRTGAGRRANRAQVEFRGMTLWVDYFADGAWMPATGDDPAEYPTAAVKSVELEARGRSQSGEWVKVLVDMTEILSEFHDEIAERIERSWQE